MLIENKLLHKLLIIAAIGFLALGGYLILGAIFPRGGYGPPDDLVLGLGILVTIMGTVLIAISFAAKTQKRLRTRRMVKTPEPQEPIMHPELSCLEEW